MVSSTNFRFSIHYPKKGFLGQLDHIFIFVFHHFQFYFTFHFSLLTGISSGLGLGLLTTARSLPPTARSPNWGAASSRPRISTHTTFAQVVFLGPVAAVLPLSVVGVSTSITFSTTAWLGWAIRFRSELPFRWNIHWIFLSDCVTRFSSFLTRRFFLPAFTLFTFCPVWASGRS